MNIGIGTTLGLIALISVAACSAPGTTLRHAPEKPDIMGISDTLQATKRADVVLVHGMCPHGEPWVVDAGKSLADALQMTAGEPKFLGFIGQNGGRIYRTELTGNDAQVTAYAILWSPAAAAARRVLCYDKNEPTADCAGEPTLPDARVLLNRELKNQIMDACLSEAMYAVGADGIRVVGQTIEDGLAIALSGGVRPTTESGTLSLKAVQSQTAPLFVITESLGSKLFVDAAIRMANRDCDAMADAIGRTVQIFMEANQLPILSLAYSPTLRPECLPSTGGLETTSNAQGGGLGGLARLRSKGRERARKSSPQTAPHPEMESIEVPLRVAAFSDPNDILSYTLVPATNLAPGLKVADIVLVNDWQWFGLFENPSTAHLDYSKQCRVKRVIAQGAAGLDAPCGFGR